MVGQTQENIVQDTPVQGKEPEVVQDTKPATVDYDPDAVATIKQQLAEITSKYGEQGEKLKELDRIKKAIAGDDPTVGMTEKEKERFFQDLADNPTETIKKLTQQTASEAVKNEIEEMRQWRRQQELTQANTQSMSFLKANDPEFDNIYNNMGKYIKSEEFEEYKDRPDGFDTLYSKAKTRMAIDNMNKTQKTQAATNTAKNIANQTANSEIPVSSGIGKEETTASSALQVELEDAKENFDSRKATDILTNDIWAIFTSGTKLSK